MRTIRFGAWLMIGLNLLMAFGCIWIFMRMAPAIALIIDRNERSLEACQEMLAALARITDDPRTNARLLEIFRLALEHTQHNITEKEEPAAIQAIRAAYPGAFAGHTGEREQTVSAITLLAKFNRNAMIAADQRAQQLGHAGAWGVVFMAATIFFAGMLFKRNIRQGLVLPLEEIRCVVAAHLQGDSLRRCSGIDLPKDIRGVFNDFNELLDRSPR